MRKLLVLGAFAFAACGGKDTTSPPNTTGNAAAVGVVAISSSMVVAGTQQLTTTITDANGKAVSSATVTWSSSTTSVATVSSSGIVSAVAPGTTAITARTGNVSGSVNISVFEDPCSKPISLQVGEVRTYSGGATVACISLAATTGASDFLIVGTNTRPAQDDLLAYSINLETAAGSSSIAPSAAESLGPREIMAQQEDDRRFAVHARLRDYERRVIGPMLPEVARRRASLTTVNAPIALSVSAASVGDTVTIRVPNLNMGKDICADNIPVRAVTRAISSKATILQDITSPANGFTVTDYNEIGKEFDDLIFPTDTSWFGRPTDINNDGHITILYTPEVNKITLAGSAGFTAGFFFGSDLFKKAEFTSTNNCRNQTNEQELFYVLTPDPTGQYNNIRTTSTVRQGTRGVIAHEFQHMINQGVRQFNPAVEALETFWLNEGMSHFAEEIVGRALHGFGDFQRLSYNDVNPTPLQNSTYQAFFRQNLSRLQRWMLRPDTSAPVSQQNRNQLAPRGASWSLLRYVVDQYSGGAARAFTRALAAGPQTDVTNLLARTKGAQFDQIITGWLVASFADGLNVPGLPSRYGFLSWNMREVMSQSSNGPFPLLVNTFPGTFATQVLSSSGSYFQLTRASASPQVQLKMLGTGGASLVSDYPTVILVRLR